MLLLFVVVVFVVVGVSPDWSVGPCGQNDMEPPGWEVCEV